MEVIKNNKINLNSAQLLKMILTKLFLKSILLKNQYKVNLQNLSIMMMKKYKKPMITLQIKILSHRYKNKYMNKVNNFKCENI